MGEFIQNPALRAAAEEAAAFVAEHPEFVESIPGLLVSENAKPPQSAPMLDQFTLDGPPLSVEARLTIALIRRVDALAAEVRGMREEQRRGASVAKRSV